MNYEKKYNDLVNDLKELWNCHTNDSQLLGELAEICPELAESEDEKIIKTLQEYVKNRNWMLNGPTQDEVLAWLEKQKGKMTAEEFESSELFQLKLRTKYANGYQDGLVQEKPNARQRLAEWSKTEEGKAKYEAVAKEMREEVQKEQKSEERFKEAREKYQVEWSEEDRLHYANVLEALEYVKGCKSDYDKIEAIKSDIAWLKSLRPSWKPSEEQMEAFRSYIGDFQERAEAAVGGWNNFDVMIRLFEQLKKLM